LLREKLTLDAQYLAGYTVECSLKALILELTPDVDKAAKLKEITAGFEAVDAYRYNSASIRVRVIDKRFEGLTAEKRDAMVEPHLEKLPERTQADIISLFTFARSELKQTPKTFREFLMNTEFEVPSPSMP